MSLAKLGPVRIALWAVGIIVLIRSIGPRPVARSIPLQQATNCFPESCEAFSFKKEPSNCIGTASKRMSFEDAETSSAVSSKFSGNFAPSSLRLFWRSSCISMTCSWFLAHRVTGSLDAKAIAKLVPNAPAPKIEILMPWLLSFHVPALWGLRCQGAFVA